MVVSNGTWYRTKMFEPEEIRKLTKTPLPLRIRLALKFKHRFYATEENMTIEYKDYKDKRYILKVIEGTTK